MTATFYALQPRWLGSDRYFKIYVTEQELRGGLIGGQFYDEDAAYRMVQSAQMFAPLVQRWADRSLRQLRQRELEYDQMDLASAEFLQRDRRNFRLAKADIVEVRADRKKRVWTGHSDIAGTLRLRLRDGSKREWIIVGEQNLDSTYDADHFYVKDVLILIPKQDAKPAYDLRFVCGVLNSVLMKFYYRTTFPTLHVQNEELASLPLPSPEKLDRKQHDRLVALVDKMLTLTPALRAAKNDAERSAIANALAKTDHDIDQLVYQLYALTPEEIALVEGAGTPAAPSEAD